jgi:hypothetical protein
MIQLRVIPADARPDPLFVTTAVEASFGAGFYEEEHDGTDVFRWMGERAVLGFPPDPVPRFLAYWACSEFYDLSQRLALSADNQPLGSAVTRGWAPRPSRSSRHDSARAEGEQSVPARALPE